MSYNARYYDCMLRAGKLEESGVERDIKSLITAAGGSLRTLAGPSHAYSAAAGQVPDGLGGVQVNTIPPVHDSGYYGGLAYTNLFAGGPTGVEAKVLIAQKYCLQCVGGSVDAGAYGTATPSAPLIFTASAASQNFTPSGCTAWMLSAAGGYVYPLIPPGQSVVSTVGTTGGNGIQVPLTGSDAADRLIECFRGVPDGTELFPFGNFDTDTGLTLLNSSVADGKLVISTAAAVIDVCTINGLSVVAGERYLVSYDVIAYTSGSIKVRLGSSGNYSTQRNGIGRYTEEVTISTSASLPTGFSTTAAGFVGTVDNLSIQKLTPAVGTVGVLMQLGVGSAETPGGLCILSSNGVSANTDLYVQTFLARLVQSYDGVNAAGTNNGATWSRNEYHMKFVEFNGTKFRVGNKRYTEAGVAIDADIVWSHATLAGGATFDGSFNPTTFLRWFLNSSVPNWMRVMMVSNLAGLGDTELLRRITKYGKF